jgi:phosphatidylglycerophosphate synthase
MIPKRRSHSVADVIVLVVMTHVIFLQPKPDASLHGKMVRRIMERIVEKIAGEQAREHRRGVATEKENKQSIEDYCERHAHDGRHDQAAGVIGIIMMHAMEHEVKLLSPFAPRLIVENPAVHRVLDETPNQDAGPEQARHDAKRQSMPRRREIEHVTRHRRIDDERYRRVHVRKELHEIAFEHPHRLVLVGDVTLHRGDNAQFLNRINGGPAWKRLQQTHVRDRNGIATVSNLRSSNGLVTPRNGQPVLAQGLAFKAFEIEELADVYFFRPFGAIIARVARAIRMTPTQLTVMGTLVGIAGGAQLWDPRLGLVGFALLILHSIIDSADGQLARMTGQVTELGRVLDGVGGYFTFGVIYLSIATGVIHRGGNGSVFIWMLLAALSNVMQAQVYDYHRTAYITVVLEGRAPTNHPTQVPPWIRGTYRGYLMMQRWLIGLHAEVETALASRSEAGSVRENDRTRYRDCFYWPLRGWNFLGDNTRFYAIGVLVWLQRIDLFLAFVFVPMNLALLSLWFWQRRADRKFLAGL